MDSLVALGSAASYIYSIFAIYAMAYYMGHGDLMTAHHYAMELYLEGAAMILTLITVGKYMETRSKGKTSEAISKLMDLAPKMATVMKDGKEVEIPVEQVARWGYHRGASRAEYPRRRQNRRRLLRRG